MGTSNLFERIEGYAKENFTTETFAYILDSDPVVRKEFLKLLLSGKLLLGGLLPDRLAELRKTFRSCRIETQQSFDFGRPDLEIKSKTGARLFVEVKTQSPEGDGQIKNYLRHGHVAYLTPPGHDGPELPGADTTKFLGQLFWDEVHSMIRKYGSHNVLHRQFLRYLEARGMGPLEPISKDDLTASLRAAGVIRKFQELVVRVREEIEPDWKKEFGKNVGGRQVDWGSAAGDLPYWWFRADGWKKPEKRLFLAIGVYIKKGVQDRPCFYVELGTNKKKFGRELEADRKFRGLCKDIGWKWEVGGIPTDWVCCKAFPVGTGRIDKIAQQQVSNIRSEEKKIRKLVKFLEKKLAAR